MQRPIRQGDPGSTSVKMDGQFSSSYNHSLGKLQSRLLLYKCCLIPDWLEADFGSYFRNCSPRVTYDYRSAKVCLPISWGGSHQGSKNLEQPMTANEMTILLVWVF